MVNPFHPFHVHLPISYLKWISCRQHMLGHVFKTILPVSFYIFRSFTFNIITDIIGLKFAIFKTWLLFVVCFWFPFSFHAFLWATWTFSRISFLLICHIFKYLCMLILVVFLDYAYVTNHNLQVSTFYYFKWNVEILCLLRFLYSAHFIILLKYFLCIYIYTENHIVQCYHFCLNYHT